MRVSQIICWTLLIGVIEVANVETAHSQQIEVVPFTGSPVLSDLQRSQLERGINPRIVGGKPIQIQQAPWQAGLVVGKLKDPARILECGGSLISGRWVVTAAHCLTGKTEADVDVIANTTYWRYDGSRRSVEKLFRHPQFDPVTLENDIALIKLKTPMPSVRPIPMAVANLQLPDNANLDITGWGAVIEGEPPTDQLMAADVPLVSNDTCNESYGGKVRPNMMCGGLHEGGVDACQGDSGGPSTAIINHVTTLVGITSWGEGCARRLKYGVYTRVEAYRVWIDETIHSNQ